MANFTTDTFTGSSGLLSDHIPDSSNNAGTWTHLTGSTGTFSLDGAGSIGGSTNSADANYYAPGNPANADQEVTAIVRYDGGTFGSADIGVLARINTGVSGEFYAARYNSSGFWELYCFKVNVGGAGVNYLSLGTYNQVLTAGSYTLKLRVAGSLITVFIDGISRISASDSNITAAGKTGVTWFSISAASLHLDSFSADDYAPALTAGTITPLSAITTTAISATATAATFGTAPYTYQWYRNTGKNSGPGNGATLLTGQTTLTLSDTTASQGEIYWYWIKATDSAGSPATVISTPASSCLADHAPLLLLCVGTSWTARTPLGGQSAPTWFSQLLPFMNGYRYVNVLNQGVGATSTTDWLTGSSNLNTALAAGAMALASMPPGTVKYCHFEHGFNDAPIRDASGFLANLQDIYPTIITAGWKIIHPYPAYLFADVAYTAAQLEMYNARMKSFQVSINTMVTANSGNAFIGATGPYNIVGANPGYEDQDNNVHLNAAATQYVATAWAQGIQKVVDGFASSAGNYPVVGSSFIKGA